MENKKAIDIIDSMINAIPEKLSGIDSFTCSPDIYNALELEEIKSLNPLNDEVSYKEYKGYDIFISYFVPQKEYACAGSLYF